jgi:hypothetical protein
VACNFRQCAGQFHASGAAADHHEIEPRLSLRGILFTLGAFECDQYATANGEGVFQRLQPRRIAFPLVMSEVGMRGAGGDDQGVIGQFALREMHDAAFKIDVERFVHQHRDVLVLLQDLPQGRSDRRRGKAGRGDLVEQRLEQMMIAAVDQGDANIGIGQFARGGEAAETAAEDDDMGARVGRCVAFHRMLLSR